MDQYLGHFTLSLTFAVILSAGPTWAQESVRFSSENFEDQVLQYRPSQREGVSDRAYQEGLFYLEQTQSVIGGDVSNFNVAHYWNLAVAFLVLDEPNEHIALAFQAAIEDNPDSVCEYLNHMGADSRFEAEIPDIILPLMMRCDARPVSEDAFDVENYISEHNLDAELVRQMVGILEDDQRYRRPYLDEQAAFDAANQARIDALFDEYGAYIGQSLVGEELDYVMFLVIQHSNLEYMERYLPYVHEAVATGELGDVTPLKMLLDRIYVAREGYQIFGSQGAEQIASEEIRQDVMQIYGIAGDG